jgi:glycine hydroxymethyltransferase
LREAPKIIVAGYTAYPRLIDFREFRKIASAAGAILMADISHIAGLIAAGFHPSPFPYADIVTTTIHKTLRGPRSAVIFSKKEYSEKIDRAVFPGLQGGPHINQIAAIAVAFEEARRPEFKSYAEQIIKNAKCLSLELKKLGWRLVSGGTDNHLLLVDTWGKAVSGKEASDSLEDAGIIVNKNTIPYDKKSPVDPSGIRLGAPAITTRGMKEKEVCLIAEWIDAILKKTSEAGMVKSKVFELCKNFPLPY